MDNTQQTHELLLSYINPLVDFMEKEKYTYLVVIGKNELSSRYAKGKYDDLVGMLTAMGENHEWVKDAIMEAAEYLKEKDSSA